MTESTDRDHTDALRDAFLSWSDDDGESDLMIRLRDAVLAAGFRQVRDIETLEDLEALPERSVIREVGRGPLAMNTVWEKVKPWGRTPDACWRGLGLIDEDFPASAVKLPAVLIWAGEGI